MKNWLRKFLRRPRVNVFTVVAVIAAIAFSFRLANLLSFPDRPAADIGIFMQAGAQQQVNEQPPALTREEIEKGVRDTAARAADAPAEAGTPAAGPAAVQPPVFDPLTFENRAFSAAEIEVLQALSKRREELEKREQRIAAQEALLSAAEQEVDRKIAELNKLRGEIETLLGTQQTMEADRIASLVKIYENMKPKEAAIIFNTLDMDVLLAVIGRMSERKVSPILASMDPNKARIVTIRLAEQRQLPPAVPKQGGGNAGNH